MIRKSVLLLIVVALVFTGLLSTPTAAHDEEHTIGANYGTVPTLDGHYGVKEWADADSVLFPTFFENVTVNVKAIPNSLYLAFIVPLSVEAVSFEWCSLHNLGQAPQEDDRRIEFLRSPQGNVNLFQKGTGSDWEEVDIPQGFKGGMSSNSTNWVSEMALPYDWLGITIGEDGPRGCQFDASLHEPDGGVLNYYWPPHTEAMDAAWPAYKTPDLWGNMLPSDCWSAPRGQLIIEKGGQSPPDHAYDPADMYSEMLQLVLRANGDQSADIHPEDLLLNDLTITASGTGSDQTDISSVLFVEDTNGDGIHDGSEPLLVIGTYPADDGSITFKFPDGLLIPLNVPKTVLVAYCMNTSPGPAPGSSYQLFVTDANATGVSSGMGVPVVGYRVTMPAGAASAYRYTLWSAIKSVGSTPTPSKPSLSVQKLATNDTVAAGGNITFRILVANKRDQALYGVHVTDVIPSQTTFVEAPPTATGPDGGYDAGSGMVTWVLGNMAPGDWKELRLVIRVKPGTPDGTSIRNMARAESTRPQLPVESQDEVVVVGGKIHEAYIKGYSGDLGPIFGSQRNVTRGEIAAIIARLLHLESTVTGEQFYSDVPPAHWTFKYVEAVHRAGIMTGFPDGTFQPDLPATRANVAVAMIRARDIDPVVFLPAVPFPDISGHWAIQEIETAYVLGIIEGLPDGTFHPDAPIIRAETVTLINRALGRGPLLEGPVTQHFSDCLPTDWFYGWGEESFASHKGVYMATGNEQLLSYESTGSVW